MEYSNETLTALLDELKNDIKSGFEGIHKRQDKTNGNIISNKSEIDRLKLWRSSLIGVWSVVSVIIAFLASKVF